MIAVGVPLMSPVDVSSEIPAGRVGETDQESTWPVPKSVGDAVDIAFPFVSVNELGEYPINGWISLTTMVMLAVSVPPELVAVMVYVAEDVTDVGVPEIVPSALVKVIPAGSVGDTDHEITVPPLDVGT